MPVVAPAVVAAAAVVASAVVAAAAVVAPAVVAAAVAVAAAAGDAAIGIRPSRPRFGPRSFSNILLQDQNCLVGHPGTPIVLRGPVYNPTCHMGSALAALPLCCCWLAVAVAVVVPAVAVVVAAVAVVVAVAVGVAVARAAAEAVVPDFAVPVRSAVAVAVEFAVVGNWLQHPGCTIPWLWLKSPPNVKLSSRLGSGCLSNLWLNKCQMSRILVPKMPTVMCRD